MKVKYFQKGIYHSHEVDEVKVHHTEELEGDGQDITSTGSDFQVTVTDEGVIIDLWEVTERSAPSADCTGTFALTWQEIVEELLK